MNLHGYDAQVGDEVYHIAYGKVKISQLLTPSDENPIRISWKDKEGDTEVQE